MKRRAENDGKHDDPLEAGDEGLLDLPHELQVAPHHEVEHSKGDDRRLESSRNLRGCIANVCGEDAVEPSAEFCEEAHRELLKIP